MCSLICQIQLKVHVKSESTNNYIILMPGKRVSLCKILSHPKIDPFLWKFIESIRGFSTLVDKCPLGVVIKYNILNMRRILYIVFLGQTHCEEL